ncbi:hypothetical protein B0H17DRAFT_1212207 [Mycena rosella]|uniref:DUF7918 domain-containing protein n=1 Tax=Mycena rosella TaxID=1033263 RepID=A0AAD7CSU0_MYCRO|nr:hypothetical protein B0H17DRAFT_1212207 [Mycena rosella]
MLQANGFSAWIEIDGILAAEYSLEFYEPERTITCWIPSQVGKTFSVCWRNTGMNTTTAGHVFMDGKDCGGRVLYGPSTICAIHTGVTDGTSVRQFTFAPLAVTDDDAFLGHSAGQEKLGLIEVVICPIQVIGFVPVVPTAPILDIKIHERSKTAVTHQIKLAEPRLLAMPQVAVSHRFIGPPIVTFAFKYRPLDILQANGIAPLPPQLQRPLALEIPAREPTPDDDDLEEILALRAKLDALEAKRAMKGKKVRVKEEENIPPVAGPSRKKAKLDGGRRPNPFASVLFAPD